MDGQILLKRQSKKIARCFSTGFPRINEAKVPQGRQNGVPSLGFTLGARDGKWTFFSKQETPMHSLANILVHAVFTTKGRDLWLDAEIREAACGALTVVLTRGMVLA